MSPNSLAGRANRRLPGQFEIREVFLPYVDHIAQPYPFPVLNDMHGPSS